MPDARPVVRLYTRAGCHLCVDAALALAELATTLGFDVETVDVDLDVGAATQYGDRVPVVEVGGAVVAEGPVTMATLRTALRSALSSR